MRLSELMRRLRALTRRRRLDRDLDDELAFHLAMREEEHRRDGLTPEEARAMARRQFGNPALLREETRDVWLFSSIESWLQDLRFAFRTHRRSPGFTLVAVLTLALGIGVATSMFTLIDALVLRPVPFPRPDDLALVFMGGPTGGRATVAPAVLRAWRNSPAFAGVEAAVPDTALIEANGTVAARGIAHVTPRLFGLLGGVRPVRGRLFDETDGRPGADDRVLLSEDLWRTLYHSDASLVGRRVVIDGESLLVVGILPSEFRFPRWDTVIWKALDFAGVPTTQPASFPMAYVRFAAGQPRADGLRMATEAARAADARNGKLVPIIRPLAAIDPYYERAVPLLAGGVMLVFLGLCANVSSLLLARLTERRREFGMRSALGASRGRVIRQAFLESGTLGTLGIAGGIALACVIVSVARVLLPEALLVRTLNPLNIDLRSLAIASAFGVGATLAAGLLPAWIGTRVDPIQSLRVSERAGTETRNARAFTRGLLVAEIALACILLVGATLLVRSFLNLAATDRGLDAHGVVTTSISLDRPVFSNPALRRSVAQSIEDQIRGLPGVGQLAWSYGLPPSRGVHSFGDWTPDMPGAPVVNMEVDIYSASPEFFALYGIPLLRGRSFQPSDSERAIVAGERFAKALFPNVDPIGRTVVFDTQQFEIIGIVREIHYPSLDPHVDRPEFYTAFSGIERFGTAMNIRCRDICPDAAVVRQRILRAHPDIRVIDARLLEDVYFEQLAQPRAAAALGFAFAAIATVAAAAGLFSVLSYTVSRRLREFGIRRALGASSADIRWLVLRDGLLVTSAGVAFGVVASWFVAPMMASLQYGVTITDAANWAAVFGLIAATTLFASWRPARAAGRADPVLLLKEE